MESSQFPSFWETSSVSPLSLLCLSSVSPRLLSRAGLSLLDYCLAPFCLSSCAPCKQSYRSSAFCICSHGMRDGEITSAYCHMRTASNRLVCSSSLAVKLDSAYLQPASHSVSSPLRGLAVNMAILKK